MKTLLLLLLLPLTTLAGSISHREETAELLAREALQKKDPEAKLLVCNFSKLVSEGLFTCYSANLGPSAVCDDGSRSAPFYIVQGYLDVELQPQIGKILYSEACSGIAE